MNKLLQRQLQKHFGKVDQVPENFARLLNVISDSYDHYEKDRKLIERSIELSSKEMIELNNQIKENERSELKKAHKQLKTLFENIDEVLYSIDMVSFDLLQMSAVCEKVYGYTSAEFFTDSDLWRKVIHPEDAYVLEEQMAALYKGENVVNQYRIIHKDKTIRWLENKIIPTLDETGTLMRIDGVTNDISKRKWAEKELEGSVSLLEATIESTADGILVADFSGKIVRFNKKFLELSRIPQELMDTHDDEKAIAFILEQLVSPEEFVAKVKELYFRQKDVSFDILKFKDGRTYERYSQPQLINGSCVGRVWSFSDITERTKAEETAALLSAMISKTSDAIIISDPFTNKIIFWNEGAEKLYGYNKDEVMGMSTHKLLQTGFPSAFDLISNSFHNDGYWNGELLQTNKNGGKINVETSWTLRRNVFGTAVGILEINRDITEKKNVEAALIRRDGQLVIATQIAKLGYWEFDVLRGVFTFNDQFYSIFKTTTEEVGGNTMTPERYAELFVYPADREIVGIEVSNAIGSTDPNFSREIEHRITYATGDIGWVSVHFYIVKDKQGRTVKTFGVNQDITERKNAEDTLKRSEIDLEIKNKQLEQKNRELEQFAYVASHDMQEPLRTTSSFVELLQQQYQGKLDEKADKYLTYILQASDRMKVLIKDLLDYSRIGRHKELKPVDCNIMLQEVLADIGAAINEGGAEINTGWLPVIGGYPTEIKQLFQNLIMNAIKFRKKNISSKINISAQRKDEYWQFAFADNSIGIAKQHNERIFIIFQRLHTRTEYAGSGIGLSHCKKIVELHKGKIWVESSPGAGSTFYFTLPSSPQIAHQKDLL